MSAIHQVLQRAAKRQTEFDRSPQTGKFVSPSSVPVSPKIMQSAYVPLTKPPGSSRPGIAPSTADPGVGPQLRDLLTAKGTDPVASHPVLFPRDEGVGAGKRVSQFLRRPTASASPEVLGASMRGEAEGIGETVRRFLVQRAKGAR